MEKKIYRHVWFFSPTKLFFHSDIYSGRWFITRLNEYPNDEWCVCVWITVIDLSFFLSVVCWLVVSSGFVQSIFQNIIIIMIINVFDTQCQNTHTHTQTVTKCHILFCLFGWNFSKMENSKGKTFPSLSSDSIFLLNISWWSFMAD